MKCQYEGGIILDQHIVTFSWVVLEVFKAQPMSHRLFSIQNLSHSLNFAPLKKWEQFTATRILFIKYLFIHFFLFCAALQKITCSQIRVKMTKEKFALPPKGGVSLGFDSKG